jgi:hypothetical protein
VTAPQAELTQQAPQVRFARLSWFMCLLALIGVSLIMLALVGYCIAKRITCPFELENMEGYFVDHARRLAGGRSIYGPPSAEFIPYMYMPLSYVATAGLIRGGLDGFLAMRIVSLLSITGSALAGMWIVARATGRHWLALVVPPLIAATYFHVDAFYDVGRPDNLMTLCLVLAVASLLLRPGWLSALLFAAFAAGAFAAKQSALVPLGLLAIGALAVRWKVALSGAIVAAAAAAALVWQFDQQTGGWFSRYAFGLPARTYLDQRGIGHALFSALSSDYTISTLALLGCTLTMLMLPRCFAQPVDPQHRSFVTLLIAALAAAGFLIASRLKAGGSSNVEIPYAVLSAIFLPVAVHKVAFHVKDAAWRAVAWRLGLLLMAITIGAGVKVPRPWLPTTDARQRWEEYRAVVSSYGPPERIWVNSHGSALARDSDSPTYAHHVAMQEFLGGTFGRGIAQELPRDLLERIEQRYFAAIVIGDGYEPLQRIVERYYQRDPAAPRFELPMPTGYEPGPESIWIPIGSTTRPATRSAP